MLPNPLSPGEQDIMLYILCDSLAGPTMIDPNLHGSSLEGQRSIADFFKLLDHVIGAAPVNNYKLQKLDDTRRPLADPPIERSSPGNIAAGNYLIQPSVEGGEIMFKPLLTFFDFKSGGAKHDGETTSERSSWDASHDSQGFKTRLIYRDGGCVVCLAAGIQAIYNLKDHEDFDRYEGSHIIDFAYRHLWDARGFSALVSDPFTDPANADDQFTSPDTRTKKDLRRIDSLENGVLLCLEHHGDYANFRFAIHPETHEISAFHPATAKLQGIKVKAPWNHRNVLYPSPLPVFLEMHYFTSIAMAMKGSGDDGEVGDDDEEFSEPEEVQNEKVRIWLDGSLSGRDYGGQQTQYQDVG